MTNCINADMLSEPRSDPMEVSHLTVFKQTLKRQKRYVSIFQVHVE